MAWTRIHKKVHSNGRMVVSTGYSTEKFTWADGTGGSDNTLRTSHIDIPIKGDILVTVNFKSTPSGDFWFRIEHSKDGLTWYTAAQSTTQVKSTTDPAVGDDISKITYLDNAVSGTKFFFLYDIDTHGMAKYTRFVIEDNGADESTNEVTFTLMPHNL